MKPIIQAEAAECGLACLAMIANAHGNKLSLNDLRQRFDSTLKGINAKELVSIGEALGLGPRALKAEMEYLRSAPLPIILHWDGNHFVVLSARKRQRVQICDPQAGAQWLRWEQLGEHYSGIAFEFSPRQGPKGPQAPTRRLKVRDLIISPRRVIRGVIALLFATLLIEGIQLIVPSLGQFLVDSVVPTGNLPLLVSVAIFAVAGVCIILVLDIVRAHSEAALGVQLGYEAGNHLYTHLLSLSLSYYEKRYIADILSRFNGLYHLQELFVNGIVQFVFSAILFCGSLGLIFLFSRPIGLFVALFFAITALLRGYLFPKYEALYEASVRNRASENDFFLESLRGISTIKSNAIEAGRISSWRNVTATRLIADFRFYRLGRALRAISTASTTLGIIAVLALGSLLALRGTLSAGALVALLLYVSLFLGSGEQIFITTMEWWRARVYINRLEDIVLASPKWGTKPKDGQMLTGITLANAAKVEVINLGYRYSRTERWIFRGLNLAVECGQCLAVVGQSGSGKSTLMKLILGLLEPASGEVLIDNVNAFLWRADLEMKGRRIASVLQDDTLFAGSLADNISLFDHNPDRVAIHECAQIAQIAGDIERMPMGYDSLVGDMGASLSGGQKQRIFLARALYRKPCLLLLDEATSHVDATCEAAIYEGIASLGITRIIVAHRQETIRFAQSIVDLGQQVKGEP